MRTWGPNRQELVTKGEWRAALRSAPWTVRAGTALLVGDQIATQIVEPRIAQLILAPFAVYWWAALLAGVRLVWQLSIVFACGYVVFAFAPHNTVWGAVVAIASLPFLLAPASRRYFRPGRIALPRRVAEMDYGVWETGGVRQLALRERVPAFVAPVAVRVFFVACPGRGRSRESAFSIARREFVFAATDRGLVVLRLRRPAIFSARIAGTVADLPADDPRLTWDDEAFTVDGRDYRPIPHHEADADALARQLRFARDEAALQSA